MRILDGFERLVLRVLLFLLAVVIGLATIELGWILVRDLASPPWGLLDSRQLLELFGLFLLVLIGIELLHSLRHSAQGAQAHLEVMFAVALIAVTRKVVVLEPDALAPAALLGLAALVLALALGYALVRRTHRGDQAGPGGS